MALINCSECGKQISSKAVSCPSCGNPITSNVKKDILLKEKQKAKTKDTLKGCLIVIIGIVLVSVFMINNDDNKEIQTNSKNIVETNKSNVNSSSLTNEINLAKQKLLSIPDYNIISSKGTANIILKNDNISQDDLAYITYVYIKLYTQNNNINRLFINYFLPNMDTNKSCIAVASWYSDTPQLFHLTGEVYNYSKLKYNLNKVKFNGWSSDNIANSKNNEIKPKTIQEKYNEIKNTQEFKAYIDFITNINKDKSLKNNNLFLEDPEYVRKLNDLKPKYNNIVSKKYNIIFDINSYESSIHDIDKIKSYHYELIKKKRKLYITNKYEKLKNDATFMAYLEYPKLFESKLPEIDKIISNKLGSPPTDPQKYKEYVKAYEKLDKKLWEKAKIDCEDEISKKYNIEFNIQKLNKQNPEWEEIQTWYADKQYKIQQEEKKQILNQFDKQFSGWDGSNRYAVKAIKKLLNDPSSYDHHQTFRHINDDLKMHVITRFRAKNVYGALIMNRAECDVDLEGTVYNLTIQAGL